VYCFSQYSLFPSPAAQINFTGGTVVRLSGPNQTTNNTMTWDTVDYYEEAGFRLDFISGGAGGFESNIGNYYGAGNDVIHGHWANGSFGGLTMIKVTKIDGSAFDLNYFVLTSNTDTGGGAASGNERAFIHASADGITSDYSQLLPSEDWGFPATQIFLGSQFDSVKAFWFVADNAIDCFGMDNFYIDEPAPPSDTVPEPAALSLFGSGALVLLGLARWKRKRGERG
jgi:hypothetical protein